MTVIELIRKRKREMGWTNQELSLRAGVPLGTVNKILSGATRYPREENIQALKKALQLDYQELIPEDTASYGRRGFSDLIPEDTSPYGRRDSGSLDLMLEEPVTYGGKTQEHTELTLGEPAAAYHTGRRGRYTLDDFYRLPKDQRAELIDGRIYAMAAPSLNHQTILFELGVAFRDYIRRKHLSCRAFVAPCDVCLDNDAFTMLEPDVMMVCDHEKIENGMRVNGAPDLVVEVVSPHNPRHDYFLKLMKYQNAGVKEYWIVDPQKERVLVYSFWKDSIPVIYGFGDVVSSQLYPELTVDFDQIRQMLF